MKKKSIFVFAFILLANIFMANNLVFAQKTSKADKKLAKQLCECGEKSFGGFPKFIKEMFIDMAILGEEKAAVKFMEKAGKFTPEESKEMQDFANKGKDKQIEKKLEEACKTPDTIFDKKTEAEKTAILGEMKKDKNCQLSYALRYLEQKGKKEGKSEPAYNPNEEKK